MMNMSLPFLWSLLTLLIFAEVNGEAGELELQRQKRSINLQQPRMATERGNLVFLTGSAQNIEFRTGSLGKIKLNDEDLSECLHQIQKNKEDIIELKGSAIGLPQNISSQIYQLNSKLVDLERKFQGLQQTVDKKVCSSNPCQNGGTCLNLHDSFFCICPPQWKGPLCSADVNECEIYSGTPLSCQNGGTCVNTMGSYSCHCPPETYGPQCASKYDDCEGGSVARCVHGICEDLMREQAGEPKYSCVCDAGWMFSPNSPACTLDRDECSFQPGPCSTLVQCFNTQGSFYCGACPTGWQGNGYICEDINECEINNGGCSVAPPVECVNTPGSSHCQACPPGYQGDGRVCTLTDICSVSNGGCHPDASCSSTLGSLPLCTCLPGYTGNGYGPNGCVQLSNICLSHPCLNGQCIDTVSGYFCKCDSGWTGVNCTENINECLSNPCLNGGTCVDGVDSFSCECTRLWTGALCQVPQQVCGESLSGINGSFSYRSPDVGYVHDVNCFWVIKTEMGKVLRITFTFFRLESMDNCPHEFLQVYDGDSSSAFQLGRFCGSSLPHELLSSDNALYFHLYSEHLRNGRGFTVRWETQQPECGGILTGPYGSIKSPGYPGNYPPGRDCVWIVVTSPDLLVTFTFGTLSLEHHDDCNKDYLEIRDGPLYQDPLLGKFCTTFSVPPLQTTGPFARIHFHSDSQISDQGFHITYLTSPSDLRCGGNYTDPEGELFLPELSGPFTHTRQCVYMMKQPQGEQIQINFTHVELQCQSDSSQNYIEVRDGETLLGKVCGNGTISHIKSITNSVWIRFKIDASVEKASFRAVYQVACGDELTGEGVIRSPFFPNVYPGERTCRWTIHQPQSQVILLNFTVFEIGSSAHCETDYVEIGSSSILGSPENKKYCGTDIPSFITSVYNFLYVTFVKSSSTENHGFMAKFSAEDLACGEILTESTGTIQSPGHPNVYPHGINCTWHILVQPNHLIHLMFETFHLEFHYNCTNDYLEVYDTDSETSLGRYCGKSIPPSLTSSGNSLMLVFVTDSDLAYEGFLINYEAISAATACLQDYTDDLGTFTSPNFPNNYPNNWECIYRITVRTGQLIAVHFTNFSLEEAIGNYYTDFLEIRDGGYEKSPLLGIFYGSNLPPTIISHSNKLWLKFKSDQIDTRSGFSAYWDGSSTGCGGNLTTSSGTFISPNYPMPYYHSSECYWWLKSSHGSAFELEFKDFHLEHHPNCTLDYLAVYDGPSSNSHLLTQLCGDEKPPLIRSSGDSMFIKLRTDEGQQGRGFKAEYRQTCENVVIVNQTYGILESIGYPNPYSENQHCNWTIRATTGNTVNYTFLAFDLEHHINCSTDYLELYDGPRQMGRYCGVDLPPPGSTTSSKLQVLLLTDGVGRREKGFQMQWFVYGCGGELSGATGSFSSPGFPNRYPPNKECIWYIRTDPGSSIQLTIHDFDVEYHSRCNFDVLEIYGGPDFHSPRIAQLCTQRSPENPMQVSSTGNELAIRFKTDLSINGRGFNASWQAVTGGCGGIFQAPSGEIHSPNYPSPYRSNTDCSWVIRVDRNHRVLLNFTDFDLEPQDSCIMAYDGLSSTMSRLARTCGREQLANPIVSSGNSLFLRFQSGPSRQNRGFRAQFRQACGGHILTSSFDTVSSPRFPANYPNNQNCSWIIQAQPPLNHITLSFTHFELERSTTCARDFVEILDGGHEDAPLRGRYCGTDMPHPITSFSSALTLRFVSDSSISAGGFHTTVTASVSACGGTFYMAEGIFNSPGYPDIYPPNVECVWNIVSSPGNRLQLSFISFQLEDSQDCSRDFVEIREGNATGHLVGRYCGNSFPLNYSSIVGHTLWVRFISDGSGSGTGFQATFMKIFGNDNIVGTHGKVASPFWPENYPHNSNYQWTVNVNASHVVHGRILEMDIEEIQNCYYDKLRIYDGPSIHARLIGAYCGTQTESFSSTGNSLTFHFYSDSSISGKGFLLEWFAVDAPDGVLPTIAPGACGGFLRTGDAPVFLFSPGWPDSYSNRVDCTWLIQAPDSTVELNILSLDIESHRTCAYDSLVIRDGDNNLAQQLAVLCGREIPGPIRSTGEYMFIRFTSDSSVTRAGFNASFHKSCGGYLHADRGIITSPKYPETYPSNLNCSWHVLVQSGLTIAVHFEQPFQIPNGDSSCNQGDYLVLRNGPDICSPPLGPPGGNGHFCGSHASSTLFTSDNQMFVQFISDHSNEGQGFKIKYEAKSLACGGNVYIHDADSAGYVTSPNHPHNYPPHADCIWILAAPPETRIQLQFEDRFDIEVTPNCTSNYLELRDGVDSDAPILSKFCGTSLPSSQWSSGEVMYLRFRSDNSPTHVGFKAKYSIAQCGGRVPGQSGVVESIGHPTLPYRDNLFCEWHLQGLSGHYLTISFEDFNLQNSSGCEKDFVEIWDNHTSGNILGRYCGNTIPDSIDTSSNTAVVRFVTDGSVTASGFRLRFESSMEECGGDLQGSIGTFTSPNYPNPNPHGRICEWRITAPEGRRITLMFNNLRLATHPSCNNEHVIVFNGIRSNSPQLEKLCSSVNVSNEIKSSGNTMKVIFFTDGSRPYGGFTASYTSSEDAVCGGSLPNTPEGNFTSPGYDGVRNYSRNLNCEWTLSNPNQGNSSISIHFEDFYLESHQDCQFDVLEFRVGDADGPLMWRLCGPSKPTLPLVIPYSQVWIHFVTNERVEHIGFHAKYSFTDCGGIQIGDSGVITSPNYPNAYDSLTHCSSLLEAPQGHTITLTFSDFDIEPHTTCAWDSVTVRNGGSPESPIIGQYCGNSNPRTIQSGSNQLVVTFNSDHSLQGGGFYATWNTQTLGCGGIFHSDNGTIRSPHWPQNFPENSRCSWTAITHKSKHLEISFDNNFLIPSGDGQCQNSFVKVWAGTEEVDKALLATGCGNVAPGPVITPSNTFTAVFQSQEAPAQGFSASFVSRCGSNFTGPSGYIISPNYPKQYDNNMNCTYVIEANPLSVVLLTFVSFHLEARSAVTGSCVNDGVHIIRGYSVMSTPFATVCGDEMPAPLTIAGPVLLNFYSNEQITDFGFKFSYRIISCGGVFNFSSGIITSPAYSYADYPNDMHCLYTITVSDDKVIELKFSDFDVVPSTSCSHDYLAIYDGANTSDPLLGKFCGSKRPPNVKSSNNSMLLVFKTDSFQTAKGWKMSFRQTLGPQQGCGGYLTGSNNTFASPDSDSNGMYDKNLNCVWIIIAPVNKVIHLTFNTFALEAASTRQRCLYDYVKLYDGDSENANLAGTFCGSTVPAPFISSGNFLTVQFISDLTLEREGFNATYTIMDMPCGGTYNATWTPQNISSPNSSDPDVPFSICTWVIDSPPHQQVKITVWALQLTSQDCTQNYLQLQDSPQGHGNSRFQFCGRNASAVPVFYSSMSTAMVIFKSGVVNRNSRMSFTYQIADCNRDYHKAFGNLRSPGWPDNYDNDKDCTVTLTAPQNHTISLFFHSLGIENSVECRNDFLEVRNGSNSNSPLLGKYCGTLLPNPVFSQNNELYLRFKSDSVTSDRGYEIIWTSSPSGCGGTLYGDRGSFTSPGYPGTYPNNTYCEWVLVAPAGRLVTINFYFISIDDPGDCVQNYLTLYDGPNASSPSSGPYCGGDTSIAPFVASSNQVFIKFHADYARRPSAFRLTWDS
ncbi:cubilin precursor [Homo sapiens]|uniref:Cubilin n=4 Tax=Homo sapiens TaxID=9606 RepID=CUBN_HUMAN|nr:cubilin precursor [Homo sapiens]O60494.5 RecName: Full=Cubilin; AltName: Full=460 kDa receptor; AltName: Full=Intestinal intrinsic factor receptor; AltName: Full=Intrinsic factor-cobalamin receptor; AltName: Full=Intrinsic factor-vitamin B12 receptor; Flags: Precursor [Homo sapiens]ACA05973.1 cubilin precursor variant 1 [Homo sapiens]ACA05974.1 cubilin precursor variant 2 [Homo sapiens]|eukprot:NP_001072.2 cubilin precursor [Homo sapiens]